MSNGTLRATRSLQIEEFSPGDMDRLEAQGNYTGWLWPATPTALAESGLAFTVINRANQRVVCCTGMIIAWEGRAAAWIVLDREAHRHMVALHRWASHMLDTVPMRRLEMVLAGDDAEPLFRWARMLGFGREGHMTAFYPDGRDGYMYAKIRQEA